jgi:signal transduction histidine kinase
VRRSDKDAATRPREAERDEFTPPSRVTVASDLPEGGSGSGSRLAVRNWRVRTRLNAILLIPVLVALVFGGFRVRDSVQTWRDARDAQHTAQLVRAAATYGNALINERDRSAAPLLAGHPDDPSVERARNATDRAKTAFDSAARDMPKTARLKRRLAIFRQVEPRLSALRQHAYSSSLGGVRTEEGYVTVQHPLMEFANELGFGTGNATAYGRTLYSISLGKAAQSLERSIGTHLLVEPGPGKKDKQRQLTAFASYAYLERIAMEEYAGGGTPSDVSLLKREAARAKTAGDRRVAAAKAKAGAAHKHFTAPPPAKDMVSAIGSGASASKLKDKGITADSWFASASGTFDAYRAVEKELTQNAVDETAHVSSDARRDALVNAAIVLAALLVAFLIARLVARQMSRSMARLRGAAFGIAEQRLPSMVDQLSRTDPGGVDTRVAPIPIDTRDEIGEVARAFDQVHREAVRLAAEQALLRGNVNAIFTNLSQRNQGLIERQLGLISDLENNEADPDQLESLFGLDHLATRMRRNGENLLVLAGREPDRDWGRPVPLVDILRAASSEVEDYARIELSGVPEGDIHGQVVNDLVHLLAELLENATSFSSPQTRVRVTATRLPDGRVMIEIHDRGIGLTAEDFADINHKLANPPTVDAAVSRRMGLYVVGRLADRHGIRVQLRPSGETEGTTSLVMLPEHITRGGGREEEPEQDFTVSRIVPQQPEQQLAYEEPLRSAAELGFDDAQYLAPRELSPLDAVGGPPPSEERRHERRDEQDAALESRQGAQPAQEPWQEPRGGPGEFPQPGQAPQPQRPPQPSQPQPPQSRQPPPPRQPQRSQAPRPLETQRPVEPRPYQEQQRPQQSRSPQASPYEPSQVPSYNAQFGPNGTEAESSQGVHEDSRDRVGFDHPGPSPSSFRSTTGAGLPRRERGRSQIEEGPEAQQPQHQPQPEAPVDWRSANDERWSRAGRLREPQAGGVTSSGLPRRVPRANLVEGAAEQSPRGGPMVSRAPEDVRGRLANLHRGVRRGRTAGDATQNDRQGYGPGSTYDQER